MTKVPPWASQTSPLEQMTFRYINCLQVAVDAYRISRMMFLVQIGHVTNHILLGGDHTALWPCQMEWEFLTQYWVMVCISLTLYLQYCYYFFSLIWPTSQNCVSRTNIPILTCFLLSLSSLTGKTCAYNSSLSVGHVPVHHVDAKGSRLLMDASL